VRRATIQTCNGITCKRQIQIVLMSLMPLDKVTSSQIVKALPEIYPWSVTNCMLKRMDCFCVKVRRTEHLEMNSMISMISGFLLDGQLSICRSSKFSLIVMANLTC
jgi:homoserine trans-succinylase